MNKRKIAVIACNLGGPDGQAAVRPFLFNLFNDKAIIAVPQPIRFALALLISSQRAKMARANYAMMGGGSPIVPETRRQIDALDSVLVSRLEGQGIEIKSFLAMRYWAPTTREAAQAAKDWGASEAILLPLYPQFSTSTTGSSLAAWRQATALPTRAICCYPAQSKLIQAHADAIMAAWNQGGQPAQPRLLFSAHGLPQRMVDGGDPYQWQIEQTVAAVSALLPAHWDKQICYQSRVGPLKWIGPSTDQALHQAARDNLGVLLSPIAFVSEHVETLVELDHEYGALAKSLGLPFYLRVPALGINPSFIEGLAEMVIARITDPTQLCSAQGARICPAQWGKCPMKQGA